MHHIKRCKTVRYDAEHKQRTHDKVVKAAARAIRAKGPDRVAVAEVMAQVGLTHGGFYAHFASKDDLVGAAIGQMFEESRARLVHETADRGARDALNGYVDFYLSQAHRDARRSGCPIAALASDLPRLSVRVRSQFAAGRQRLVDKLGSLIRELGQSNAAAEANSVFAELLGALSLARMEPDAARSDAILAASKRSIKRRLGLEAAS
jgi:TetR/AcrR family transcriptional repressor of nem operon